MRWHGVRHLLGVLWALALAAGLLAAQAQPAATPAATEPAQAVGLDEHIIELKLLGPQPVTLQTTLFKPPGPGPFPLVLINHGKSLGDPRQQPRARYLHAAKRFVERGYLVAVPMRQGFAGSSGVAIGLGCQMQANGLAHADDVRLALQLLGHRPEVDASRVVVLGQSHGGLATLALGVQPPPGVRLLLNFAGGLRQPGCGDWQRTLVQTVAAYGRSTRLPSLWIYSSNDSLWPPALYQAMFAAYTAGGAPAVLFEPGPFGSDGHNLFGAADGAALWWPRVEAFLQQYQLPTAVRHRIGIWGHEQPPPPPSGYAALDDDRRLPGIRSEQGRAEYRRFLAQGLPRAFAIGRHAAAWSAESHHPMPRALQACQKSNQGQPCQLYAVDDAVVWNPASATLSTSPP